jgi:hypothetical protein
MRLEYVEGNEIESTHPTAVSPATNGNMNFPVTLGASTLCPFVDETAVHALTYPVGHSNPGL